MTGQEGQKNDLSGTGDGRRDGKNMTGQTFLKQNFENINPLTLTDPRTAENKGGYDLGVFVRGVLVGHRRRQ